MGCGVAFGLVREEGGDGLGPCTAGDPSTMLLAHGGSKLCSSSQPWRESHSSTTMAVTDLPLLALITMLFWHHFTLLNHPVNSATT